MSGPRMGLGSVHLRVRDRARSEAFYATALGLRPGERHGPWTFLTSGERHHVLALEEVGLERPEPGHAGACPRHVGLFHVGWEVPDAWEFWRVHRRLASAGVRFEGVDQGFRWALRFADPDGNGVEVWVDSRALPGGREAWEGRTAPIDHAAILETLQAMVPGIVDVDG